MLYPARWKEITVDQSKVLKIECSIFGGPPGIELPGPLRLEPGPLHLGLHARVMCAACTKYKMYCVPPLFENPGSAPEQMGKPKHFSWASLIVTKAKKKKKIKIIIKFAPVQHSFGTVNDSCIEVHIFANLN